jgi:hypothetical protein
MNDSKQDFYRPRGAAKEVSDTTELEKSERLTAAIAANVKFIHDDTTDLDRLGHKLADLATALQLTRELVAELNLPELELRLASISTALRIIESDSVVQELKAER